MASGGERKTAQALTQFLEHSRLPTRRPCTTANCTDASSVLDWVLATATSYIRGDGTRPFTTDSTTNTVLNGGSASSCNTTLRLLCVEQVPGVLPATH